MIRDNLEIIKKNIRDFSLGQDVHILGAAKKQPIKKIEEAISLGLKHIGENYLQEALEKQEALKNKTVVWHFIGPIQSNKIKDIVKSFEFIHSVSRIKEIKSINKAALEIKKNQKIFLQINIADEPNKNGISIKELEPTLLFLNKCTSINCVGIMCMPPLAVNSKDSEKYFKKMTALLVKYKKTYHTLNKSGLLSMGTSSDYTIAVQNGAHFIRLGTVLFGKR